MGRLLTVVTALLLLLAPAAHARPGDLDRSFSGDGRLGLEPPGTVAGLTLVDGVRPLLTVNTFDPGPSWVRLTAAGRVTGRTPLPGAAGFVQAVARGFALRHAYTAVGAPAALVLTRTLGTQPVTFTLPAADLSPMALAVDARGRVLIGGDRQSAGQRTAFVARFEADGRLDPTYPLAPVSSLATVTQLLPQADGGVLITDGGRIARRDADGRPTAGFKQGRSIRPARDRDGFASVLAPGPAGTVLAFGRSTFTGTWVARLRADGRLDRRFGRAGRVTLLGVDPRAIARDGRGRLVLAGSTGQGPERRAALLRLSARGRADRGFGRAGLKRFQLARVPGLTITASQATHVAIDRRGRIVVAGTVYDDEYDLRDDVGNPYPAVARLRN